MSDPQSKDHPYQIHRFKISLNVAFQIFLGLVIFGFVNYLAFNHFRRWDFSRSHQNSISEQTKKVIGQLTDKDDLKIIVLVAPNTPISDDLKNLFIEYQVTAKKLGKKIDVETFNPYSDINHAKELVAKYQLSSSEAVVILDYQKRTKFLKVLDMIELSRSDNPGVTPQITAFKGEQVITQGLLGIIEPEQSKIYFVDGLGGHDFLGKDANKTFLNYLARQNLAVAPLNLLNVEKIPSDAKVIVFTGPKYDPTDRAFGLLKDYWAKKGRLLVLLDPTQSTPSLLAWLRDEGIYVQDDRLKKTQDMGQGLLGVYKNTIANILGDHALTKEMAGIKTSLDGPTRSIRLDRAKAKAAQLRLTPLIQADEGYWGETNYMAGEDVPLRFDEGVDHAAPLFLAASVEQGAVEDERVKVDSARMVVVGNADFLDDGAILKQNLDFSIAAINWLASREELISIPPIEKTHFRLGLTDEQLHRLNLLVLLVIPGAVALFGFGVCWIRRR